MKNAIYFLTLLLIAFCSCSSKGEYTNILTQFVELNNAMGVAKEDAGLIVGQVEKTLRGAKKVHSDFTRTIATHCASALSQIDSRIKSLGASIVDATSALNTWRKNLASATQERKNAQANIVKARAQLAAIRKRVEKLLLDYKVFATEADKKLIVVKSLRDIITDELFNRVPGAFVQIKKFQEKLAELKGLLNNNNDSLYAPIVGVLLDLATEQNFADQGILRKILENLKNLDRALRDFRTKQEKGLNAELKLLRKNGRNTRKRINDYRRIRHAAASKQIDAGHYIGFYTHEIAHFTAERERINDERRLFVKLCEFEKKVNADNRASYKKFHTQIVPYLYSQVQKLSK